MVEYLAAHGVDATHWSEIGDPLADDATIMDHAKRHGFVVFTHDLDFGSILAVTHALGPSVIQARMEDPVPATIGNMVISAVRDQADRLSRGALITLEPEKLRARILPIIPGMRPL